MSCQTVSPSVPALSFRACLHSVFPTTPRAANAFADALLKLQQHTLWNIEDKNPAEATQTLLETIGVAHVLIVNLQSFRLARLVNPELEKMRTDEIDRSIEEMERLALCLSATCRTLLQSGPLTPAVLLSHCNGLDGTLSNLQLEAQFFETFFQQPISAAA